MSAFVNSDKGQGHRQSTDVASTHGQRTPVAPASELAADESTSVHTISKVSHEDNSSKHEAEAEQEAAKAVGLPAAKAEDDDIQKPIILTRAKFLPLYFGMILTLAVYSLDNTIVATAQVPIVQGLGGESLITWLPTTYLIGQCSFSLLFGQILTIFPSKLVYLFSIFLFALGSLISGVAPNMAAMLSGRTISGIGASGIFMSIMQVMLETTTLAGRAIYMGMIGLLLAVTMVCGPLIGGAFSDSVTWRWCFYLNLPICGVSALATLILFDVRPPLGSSKTKRMPILKRLIDLDWIGLLLLTGVVCMVIVPMQEAQNNGWASAATLVPICLAPVVGVITAFWFRYRQHGRSDDAHVLLPLRVFTNVNFIGCSLVSFIVMWVVIEYIYLIPLYYETVLGHTALQSGVDMLPLIVFFGVVSAIGGILTKKTGHYYPQFIICPFLGIAGFAMMYTIQIDSTKGFHIGSQILIGVSIGPIVQAPMLALQANLEDKTLIARAMSFCAFAQRFGGGVGTSITSAILFAQLPDEIRKQLAPLPGVDATQYEHISYNAIRSLPKGPVRTACLQALNNVIDYISIVGVPLFAIMMLLILFTIKARNVNTNKAISKRQFIRKAMRIQRPHDEEQQKPSSSESAADAQHSDEEEAKQ